MIFQILAKRKNIFLYYFFFANGKISTKMMQIIEKLITQNLSDFGQSLKLILQKFIFFNLKIPKINSAQINYLRVSREWHKNNKSWEFKIANTTKVRKMEKRSQQLQKIVRFNSWDNLLKVLLKKVQCGKLENFNFLLFSGPAKSKKWRSAEDKNLNQKSS